MKHECVTLCKACLEIVSGLDIGKYGPLSFCQNCSAVEPDTIEGQLCHACDTIFLNGESDTCSNCGDVDQPLEAS